jgi:hypothetical protein
VNPNTARTLVLVSGGLMFAAIGIRRSQISDPFRYAWAAGVITLFLSLLADIAPEVAGPSALLVLLAVYWSHRGTLGSLPGLSGKTAPASSSAGAPPGVQGPVGTPSTAR